MNAKEAEALVKNYVAKRPKSVNASFVAESIGVTPKTVTNWLHGHHEPQNPEVWVQIAFSLGLALAPNTEALAQSVELALQVLTAEKPEDLTELKRLAANLIRKINEKN